MLNEMNDIFSFPLLFQMSCGSIYICISEFIMLTSKDFDAKAQFMIALLVQLLRFYLYCKVGEDTIEKVVTFKLFGQLL